MSHDLISGPGGVDVEKVAEILARKAEEVLARETALEEREEKVERREREVSDSFSVGLVGVWDSA